MQLRNWITQEHKSSIVLDNMEIPGNLGMRRFGELIREEMQFESSEK